MSGAAIRNTIDGLAAAIAADPAKARAKTAPATARLVEGLNCEVTLGIQLDSLEVTVESGADHRDILGLDDRIQPARRPCAPS
jgi:hypothetical protein